MRLESVEMKASAYCPAKKSAGLQESTKLFAEPDYRIDVDGHLLVVTHRDGNAGVYWVGDIKHGIPWKAPVAAPSVAPAPAPSPVVPQHSKHNQFKGGRR